MSWDRDREVVPRHVDDNPRCPDCKSGPMFHPRHKWGPCQVVIYGEGVCGCTANVQPAPDQAQRQSQ